METVWFFSWDSIVRQIRSLAEEYDRRSLNGDRNADDLLAVPLDRKMPQPPECASDRGDGIRNGIKCETQSARPDTYGEPAAEVQP